MRAVLWDADGVLQDMPTLADPTALRAVLDGIPGYLVGAPVDEAIVVDALERLGFADQRDEVLRVWSTFPVLEDTLRVVAEVRAAGTPCYLATNQDSFRASRMRALTPYDGVLDGSYYSCDLGVAKPSVDYFERIADDLGLEPGDLLFVDDHDENVAGGREAGLNAEQWHHTDGVDALRELLAAHGVILR